MMEQKEINGLHSYIIKPSGGEAPKYAVILVHGYGADGKDLISLGAEWAPQCPDTIFIAPDAPSSCEQNPYGRQWFSLEPYSRDAMKDRIHEAWTDLSDYIDAVLREYDIDESHLILCGFSQGTMMALHAALSRPTAVAGVLGYSGMLLSPEAIKSGQSTFPIHLIHGEADPVIPVEAWDEAMSTLEGAGFPVSGYKTPNLPHGIDGHGVKSGLDFIQKLFLKT